MTAGAVLEANAGADVGSDPGTGVEERLAVIAGHLNALHAQLVDLIVEAEATGAWSGAGIRSIEHWLTWKVGVDRSTAVRLVRLAHARGTHPALSNLFADGALSLDQAAAAVLAPPHVDVEMAQLAPLSTVSQIRTEVRVAATAVPPTTGTPPSIAHEPERMVVRRLAGGRWSFEAELDADHGAVVNAALAAAHDRLFHGGQTHVTWVDALVDTASTSLDADPQRAERFRVNVHLDPTADIRAQWTDGSSVPPWLERLLTCDGAVSPVFTDGAKPVSVGRTQRTVPERTKRLVLHRDRGRCRVPWCDNARGLQVHHIDEWVRDDGPTDTHNLVAACPGDHRELHRGEFSISGNADDPDGLVFRGPDGSVIEPGSRPKKPTGPPPMPARPYDHPLGERLDARSLFFRDPPDADRRDGAA